MAPLWEVSVIRFPWIRAADDAGVMLPSDVAVTFPCPSRLALLPVLFRAEYFKVPVTWLTLTSPVVVMAESTPPFRRLVLMTPVLPMPVAALRVMALALMVTSAIVLMAPWPLVSVTEPPVLVMLPLIRMLPAA